MLSHRPTLIGNLIPFVIFTTYDFSVYSQQGGAL
jgi:hypothetical protein